MIPTYTDADVAAWLSQREAALTHETAGAGGADTDQTISRVAAVVTTAIERVRTGGDSALADIARELGDGAPEIIAADDPRVEAACLRLPAATKETLAFAGARIEKFARAVTQAVTPVSVDFDEYTAGLRFMPVQRVACYVPGGRYSLPSTALMTAVTARVAGVNDVYIMSPVLTDEVLYCGRLARVSRFVQLGGAQAVAAAALGTATIARADMIVGPGNAYVTEAKRQLIGSVGIDMLAGPSEIAIIADSQANPLWVARDMLAQAEHDPDARAYLLTDSQQLACAVSQCLTRLVTTDSQNLPPFIAAALAAGAIFVLPTLQACVDLSNAIAPEHLALHLVAGRTLAGLTNYGALFIGRDATVSYGDYAAGPNHTLPTGATARFSSGLSPLTFLRTQTWLDVPRPAARLAAYTARFAEIERLNAHRDAALARLGN